MSLTFLLIVKATYHRIRKIYAQQRMWQYLFTKTHVIMFLKLKMSKILLEFVLKFLFGVLLKCL